MKSLKIDTFYVIGISVRTTNENAQAARDIGNLWSRFMIENIAEKIPGKVDDSVYSIYTDYEKDHTRPYTTILGCKVKDLNMIPPGMIGKAIQPGNYAKKTVKGDLQKGVVYEAWLEIWNSDLQRTFTSDFEVYGDEAKNTEDATVNIYVAIK